MKGCLFRQLAGLAMLVAAIAVMDAMASAQIFSPVSPTDTGTQFVGHMNQAHSGGRPIEPALSCYPWGFLPGVINAQTIVCKNCARTNPCSAGTEELIALGVCDTTGTNCQWNCNQGAPFVNATFSASLGSTTPVPDSPTTLLTLAPALGTSATGGWLVRYVATVALNVAPSLECDVGLYLDGSSTPSAIATAANGANADTLTVPVTLAFDTIVNATTQTARVVAQSTSPTGCSAVKDAGALTGVVTSVAATARPK